MIKQNLQLTFTKNINETVFLTSSYFRKSKNVNLNLIGKFYNAKKFMNSIWSIQIKNLLTDTVPVYETLVNPVIKDMSRNSFTALDFAKTKDGTTKNVYIIVNYNKSTSIKLPEEDQASLRVTSTVANSSGSSSTLTVKE